MTTVGQMYAEGKIDGLTKGKLKDAVIDGKDVNVSHLLRVSGGCFAPIANVLPARSEVAADPYEDD